MPHIVDIHIHSHYSQAVSKFMNIAELYRFGTIKGITVMGTGDFTHPAWFEELQEKLEPAEPGLFTLKEKYRTEQEALLPTILQGHSMRFMLTVEISTIYSKGGKVRKVHSVICMPSFEVAAKFNMMLSKIGNLRSDGRPILGLDTKELLRFALEADSRALFVPAHAWTPWFSIFGSKSGFDSLEEAFEELTPHVRAIETGLSSDPFMNWRLSNLDGITFVSNSDAHSPAKLGREANLIDSELSYDGITQAIITGDTRFVGTIEFFPQEGKYHYDGHRLCDVRFSPAESRAHNLMCPVCGRPLTLGVEYRVEQLADRPESYKPNNHKKVEYIVPLEELLSQLRGKHVGTKTVTTLYNQLIAAFGDEFSLLRTIPINDIRSTFPDVALMIEKMRSGDVKIIPGYDGVYGTVKVFAKGELEKSIGQMTLLG